MNRNKLRKLILAAFFAALIFLGIYIIKIPMANGYVHFGDGLIYVAASLIPTPYAVAAAAIGGALADLLAGYAAYAPATAIVKALMALAVGLLAKNHRKNYVMLLLAAIVGGVINIAGYFAADCILFGGVPGALPSLAGNATQSVAGIVIYFVLLPLAAKAIQYFKAE